MFLLFLASFLAFSDEVGAEREVPITPSTVAISPPTAIPAIALGDKVMCRMSWKTLRHLHVPHPFPCGSKGEVSMAETTFITGHFENAASVMPSHLHQ